MKKALIGFVALVMFLCPVMALYAQDNMGYGYPAAKDNEAASGEAMAADVIVARPIGFCALVLGTAVSIVATPFALVTGTTKEVYGRLVADPFNYTIERPLGQGL
jgi:hypothetical protein